MFVQGLEQGDFLGVEPNGNDRISVSRDTLRAELAYLKLDLIQSLASKTEVDRLDARVSVIELHGSPALVTSLVKMNETDAKVNSLIAWRNRLLGAFGLAVLAEPLLTLLVIHFLH